MNHTENTPYGEPNKAAYLFWNDTQGTLMEEKAVGPAIALRVQEGDTLNIETWARFERKSDYTHDFGLVALSALLGNTFAASGGFEGYTINNTISNLEGALTAGVFPDDGGDDTRPFAYLNYIVYDEEMVYQSSGWRRVTDEAGFYPNEIGLPGPKRVAFEDPVAIEESGYIYIWVSNQSKETRVWFDDLKVTHTQNIVVQATDYGVWGDVLREQKADESIYRFGYQGQFAEKDEETGWNHFDLREYDPVTGRWTQKDPYRQFWSPYVGMGNNPVGSTDPDGGLCCGGEDMGMVYSDAMQQMDYNLYDHIKLSGGTLMNEAVVTPTPLDQSLDVLWAWAQLYEPEAYVNIMFKQAASNGKGKVTVPIVGGNFSLSKDGIGKQLITPSSSYLSYKASSYLEYRVYPAEGDRVPGEDASFRVLVLLHNKPYKVGNLEGKIQGDFGAKRDGSGYVGARIVGEYQIIRGQTSVEVNAGFRVKKPMFWIRTPIFNGSLYPKF